MWDKIKRKAQKFLEYIKQGSADARDARINNPGASYVRDLYEQGQDEQARNLALANGTASLTGMLLAPVPYYFISTAPTSTSLLGIYSSLGGIGGMASTALGLRSENQNNPGDDQYRYNITHLEDNNQEEDVISPRFWDIPLDSLRGKNFNGSVDDYDRAILYKQLYQDEVPKHNYSPEEVQRINDTIEILRNNWVEIYGNDTLDRMIRRTMLDSLSREQTKQEQKIAVHYPNMKIYGTSYMHNFPRAAQSTELDPNSYPTLEEWFKARQEETSKVALERSYDRLFPFAPYYYNGPYLSTSLGLSCASTSTSNYGGNSLCFSNQEFLENPKKYGFIQRDSTEIPQAGDITSFGHHMGIFTGKYRDEDKMLLNYSSGGDGPSSMRKNAYYGSNPPYIFKFIGLPQDSINWKQEWEKGNNKSK